MESVLLVMLLLFGWTFCPATSFHAVQWSTEVSSTQQCGTEGSSDPTDALQIVAQLIKSTTTSSSLPKSCTEIKEGSPVSPSGYYTINTGSGGSGVVVYCNMDDLSSCPALEQTLSGMKKDVDSLFSQIDSLAQEQTVSEIKEDVDSLFTQIDSLAQEQTVGEIRGDVDSLLTQIDSLAQEQTLSEIKEDVDSLFTHIDSLAQEQTVSEIKEDVDSLFTHIDSPLVSSCSEVKKGCPDCKNGVYQIAPDLNNVKFVYCVFENSTYCNVAGPWVKLASWNISEDGTSCPGELQLFVNGTVFACGIQQGASAGCRSLPLFSSPVPYMHVCGRMSGYQEGSTNAFWGPQGSDIDDPYVDGVSITRGSPRQHIWTFAIGLQENLPNGYSSQCPCIPGSTKSTPSFVGSDYFCESGCPAYVDGSTFHAADPLWDGEGCGALEAGCCAAPGLPWFHKALNAPTTDDIEMRVCLEQAATGENVLISSYEIYVL